MARLKSIELSGWKSIKHAEIDLGSINVLIGANGAGKSNLISFFKFLNDLLREKLQVSVARSGGANLLLHYGAKATEFIDADLRFEADAKEFGYNLRLAHAAHDRLIFSQERTASWRDGQGNPDSWSDTFSGGHKETLLLGAGKGGNRAANWLRTLLESCRVYHFHDTSGAAAVRLPGQVEDNGQLRADGGNLAAVLYRLQQTDEAVYKRIVATVNQINPRFGDFVLAPRAADTTTIQLNWQEAGRDELFVPEQLSDGTLRSIALVTLLLQPPDSLPDLVVIDEPELGLHPYAVAVVAGLLRAASHHCQVVVATQSAGLVSSFDPAEVIVAERRGEATEFKRLAEADLAGWLDDYSLGELWEKNVLGGGPH